MREKSRTKRRKAPNEDAYRSYQNQRTHETPPNDPALMLLCRGDAGYQDSKRKNATKRRKLASLMGGGA